VHAIFCILLSVTMTLPAAATDLLVSESGPEPHQALEIGLTVLDTGLAGDTANARKRGVFPQVRVAESRYLPFALRRTLVDSNQWGAVRVLPNTDPHAELLITGTILRSDGAVLELQLTARDSRGREWLNRIYSATAGETAYLAEQRRTRRPFQDLYNEFANDLLRVRESLDNRDLLEVHELSKIRYAASLLPETFGAYFDTDETGHFRLQRLPARGDPMMQRIDRIREQEYLFIDTIDEQYAELYTEMTQVYDLWRQFQREQLEYRDARESRIADRDEPRRGSFQALKQTYNDFKWEKIQRQEMKILAQGFDNEIAPTSMDLDGTVVKLSGSLDERYREWRRILRQIADLETGS